MAFDHSTSNKGVEPGKEFHVFIVSSCNEIGRVEWFSCLEEIFFYAEVYTS